jgi:ubiquinone biosynthesis protein
LAGGARLSTGGGGTVYCASVSVLRTIVSSSRALVTGARDVARFREIAAVFVRHGFGWVFMRLRLQRELQVDTAAGEVEAGRAAATASASAETGKRLVAALTELGPTFVKLGQILSTRPDLLAQPILDELAALQDRVDPLPFAQVREQLERNLGKDYAASFASIDEQPLAAASMAQVHRATLTSGEEVVLKIQRPGIDRKIESDLHIILALAGYVEDAFDEARAMDLSGTIQGFAKSLSQELDFKLEARNLERFRRNFADEPRVKFPAAYEALSTREVLCMEFVPGRKFSAVIEQQGDAGGQIQAYFDVAYSMLFRDGFFHGDLHPGNVLQMPDGRLGIIDCGMVGRLSPTMRDKLIDILYAVLNEDMEGLARTFFALSIPLERVDYPRFEADVIEIADRYLAGVPLSEIQIGALFSEIVAGATRHRVRMPTDFTMMFKAILTTEGLAKSLAPDIDPLLVAKPHIEAMIRERYSLERLRQSAIADATVLQQLLRQLPTVLPSVLRDIQAGELAFNVAPATLQAQRKAADARHARATRAGLAVGLLACGTYAIGLPLPVWAFVGVPYLTAGFYFAAGALLFGALRPLR